MDSPRFARPPPHLYSQSLQLRLYQAFIFSIPILFSIILFLLFYLFYLKKSSFPASTPESTLPVSSNQAQYASSSSEMVLKGSLKDKLEVVLFNEDVRTRSSACCVCLGEFEVGEELNRIATCQHLFHMDCICYWLHSNPTCPLCRCFIASTTKHSRNTLFVVSPHQREQFVMIPTEMSYIL